MNSALLKTNKIKIKLIYEIVLVALFMRRCRIRTILTLIYFQKAITQSTFILPGGRQLRKDARNTFRGFHAISHSMLFEHPFLKDFAKCAEKQRVRTHAEWSDFGGHYLFDTTSVKCPSSCPQPSPRPGDN